MLGLIFVSVSWMLQVLTGQDNSKQLEVSLTNNKNKIKHIPFFFYAHKTFNFSLVSFTCCVRAAQAWMDLSVWEMKSQLLFSSPPSSLSLSSWRAADFCLIFSSRSWHVDKTSRWQPLKCLLNEFHYSVLTENRICSFLCFLQNTRHDWNIKSEIAHTDVRIHMWPLTWQVLMLLCSSVWLLGVWAETIQRFWSAIQLLICCSRASRSTLLLSSCSTSWIWTPQTTTATTYFFWGSRKYEYSKKFSYFESVALEKYPDLELFCHNLMFVFWPVSWGFPSNWATDSWVVPVPLQTGCVHSAPSGPHQYCMSVTAGSHSPVRPDGPTSLSDTPEKKRHGWWERVGQTDK